MSKKKERKLRKLKAVALWPAIVGIIVASILFVAISAAIAQVMLRTTLVNKVLTCAQDAEKTAQFWLSQKPYSNNTHNNADIEGNAAKIAALSMGVVITDKEGNVIRESGSIDQQYEHLTTFFWNEKTYHMGINDEDMAFLSVDSDDIDVEYGILLSSAIIEEVLMGADIVSPEWGNESFISSSLWFGIEEDASYNVFVRVPITVTRFEMLSATISVLIAAFTGLLFILYQFCAVFRTLRVRFRINMAANTDQATGGKNWNYLLHIAGKKRWLLNPKRYSLVILDYGKYDTYCLLNGENAGEELLENIYQILKRSMRKTEFLCHKDQAEFCLLLVDEGEGVINGRICNFADEIGMNYPDVKQRINAAVAPIQSMNARNLADAYSCATIALRKIKQTADLRISWFDDNMREAMLWEQVVEKEMNSALANHEFEMYLQPKFYSKSERVGGAEALVRWNRPGSGIVPPGKFIPIFENNGFIMKLDDYMLEELAKTMARWIEEGKNLFPISVNVSRAHFAVPSLAENICDIVDKYGVPHKYIELEITESAFFDDKDMLLRTILKLKEAGFPISMDDFGAGYSSLNTLKELPLDVVKLDAEFFRGDDNFDRAHMIVSETIALGKKLNMHIVAEGIETREQVDFLAGERCDLIQGFYFAKPMPVAAFEEQAFG